MAFKKELIAPCGINCGVCIAYLREKNKCYGCLSQESSRAKHCENCKIKNCEAHLQDEFIYCYQCKEFPCVKIKKLDKRYVERYLMSVIENSTYILNFGMDEYISSENEKWKCRNCGEVLSVHRDSCQNCKASYR